MELFFIEAGTSSYIVYFFWNVFSSWNNILRRLGPFYGIYGICMYVEHFLHEDGTNFY
jgi:hypothetical protein